MRFVSDMSIGFVIAIIVLVLAVVMLMVHPDNPDTERTAIFGLIAALAVARMT
jgi:hypothetical protein